jgi:aspartyl/glutamyl-tRNA(Asn/Gln) amidotransferase C subunit
MSVCTREVAAVAALARLTLLQEELELYSRQLSRILDHVDALRVAPLSGLASDGVGPREAPLRADQPGADALAVPPADLAPEWVEPFFTVPRLAAMVVDDGERNP